MNYFFLFLAFLIGVTNTIQSGVNSQLRIETQNPILTSIISFVTGLLGLLVVYTFFNKAPHTSLETLRGISWWKWTGGILGAFYVMTVIVVIREIGPANMICLIVAGQLIASVVVDHFGWIGFPYHAVNAWRVLGLALIMGGVYLVLKN
jgi:transporter family-2 protein